MITSILYLNFVSFVIGSSIRFTSKPKEKWDRALGYYAVIEPGSPFTLTCKDDNKRDVNFGADSLLNNQEFDLEQFRNGIVKSEGNSLTYHKSEAAESDSGSYTCYVEEKKEDQQSIYIFVKGDSFFVAKKNVKVYVNSTWFSIPCSANWNDHNVTLFRDDTKIEEKYNPTLGFRLRSNTLTSTVTHFDCIHNTLTDSVSFSVYTDHPMKTTTPRGIPSKVITSSTPVVGSASGKIVIIFVAIGILVFGGGFVFLLQRPSIAPTTVFFQRDGNGQCCVFFGQRTGENEYHDDRSLLSDN